MVSLGAIKFVASTVAALGAEYIVACACQVFTPRNAKFIGKVLSLGGTFGLSYMAGDAVYDHVDGKIDEAVELVDNFKKNVTIEVSTTNKETGERKEKKWFHRNDKEDKNESDS